jgi:hypothetical protein
MDMPLIFLGPLAFIVVTAIGVVVSAARGGRRTRSGYRHPGTLMDPSAPLLLQSELLQADRNPSDRNPSDLNPSGGHTPGQHHHHHQHHQLHHLDPTSGPGVWGADPGNPGGVPHHHG